MRRLDPITIEVRFITHPTSFIVGAVSEIFARDIMACISTVTFVCVLLLGVVLPLKDDAIAKDHSTIVGYTNY
jgi:hypothetical protein